jgi:multiple sugar transport system substrate-binding protein
LKILKYLSRTNIYHFCLLQSILGIIVFSCGNDRESRKSEQVYWSSNNPYEIELAEYIVDRWHELNPDKHVVFQPVPEGRSSEEIILAAVVGETTPDIYSNMWQGDVEFFARAGVLVALDTMNGFWEVMTQRCDSSVMEEVTSSDGHIYQIPWKINPIMLMYNINMFKAIGWDRPPKTYSEYLEAAQKIQTDTNNDGYIDRWIGYSEILATWWQRFFDFYPLYLAASGGGKLVDKGKVVFNNQYAVQVFTFLRTIYERNYFTKELMTARQDVFLSSIVASRFTGPWEIAHAEKFKREDFEYFFHTLPIPDNLTGDIYTYGDPKNIVIFNTCTDPEIAWEFLKFMINEENDLKLLEISTQLPRRKEIFSIPMYQDYFNLNPKMKPFAQQAKFIRGTDVCPQLKEVFDVISQEYEACVIYGTKSPERAIQEAATAAQLLIQ